MQTAQGDTQAKVCKRACPFPDKDKNFSFPLFFVFSADTQPDTADSGQREATYRQQGFGVMAGEVLRINIFAKFELSASYQR